MFNDDVGTNEYVQLLSTYRFLSLTNEPTRVKRYSFTCIDHIRVGFQISRKPLDLNISDLKILKLIIHLNGITLKSTHDEHTFKRLNNKQFLIMV